MSYSQFIAYLVTRRRGLLWLAVLSATVVSLWILLTRVHLDTEVLNLLPAKFSSVQGLKLYNRDFAQTRELTFALLVRPDDADRLEEFAPVFAERLRKQPWCTRLLTGSPMESPEGIPDLQRIALPLLLNLAPGALEEALGILQPEKMAARLARLHQEIEAGSPRPEFELQLDPLGLVAPALRPFAGNASLEQDQPLTSPDRTMRLVLAVTNQPGIGAFDCQKLMDQVNTFRATAGEGWEGGPLQILVTGRSAYVAEISRSMRHDIVVTLLGSILLVGTVFFIGFHRWLPLIGMGFSLLLCCLIALASGLLIFHELNMVTIGMCAILIGLGVDSAILIFGRYQQARNEGAEHAAAIAEAVAKLGRAVFFGALTTAVGFLALLLANSAGFTQLGVLIAIGILVAALCMTSVFFLFTRATTPPQRRDWVLTIVRGYVRHMLRQPRRILAFALPVLLVLFDGVPAVVHIEEPRQGIQFGVRTDPQSPAGTRKVRLRDKNTGNLVNKNGTPSDPEDPFTVNNSVVVPFRPNAPGVIDLAKLNERLAAAAPPVGPPKLQPHEFGLEMLRFPYRQVFGDPKETEGSQFYELDKFQVAIGLSEWKEQVVNYMEKVQP